MEIALQLLINTLIPAALFGLMASGFSVFLNVAKIVDLSQGALVLILGYSFFAALQHGATILIGILLSSVVTITVALLINGFIYERLRRNRKLSQVIAMIASAGVLLLLQNSFLAIFGSRTKVINLPIKNLEPIAFGDATITWWQIIIVTVSALAWIALYSFLKKTRVGTALRATADNAEVAEIVGISARVSRRNAMLIAATVCSIAGILASLEYNLDPNQGVDIAIKDFSRAVIGGVGSVPGAMLGSFVIQTAEELGGWFWNAAYKQVISLMLVFIFLIWKPTGILGKKKI